MKVEILNGLGAVTVLPATRVLVTLDDGTPIAVCSAWMGPGQADCSVAGLPDFERTLKNLGIARPVAVDRLDARDAIEILPPE